VVASKQLNADDVFSGSANYFIEGVVEVYNQLVAKGVIRLFTLEKGGSRVADRPYGLNIAASQRRRQAVE
jgi:hypothetical protein